MSSQVTSKLIVRHVCLFAILECMSRLKESLAVNQSFVKKASVIFLVCSSPRLPRSPFHQHRQELQHTTQTITDNNSALSKRLQHSIANIHTSRSSVYYSLNMSGAPQSSNPPSNPPTKSSSDSTPKPPSISSSTKPCPMCDTEGYNGSCNGCGWGDLFTKT